jgi:hypothetical protein
MVCRKKNERKLGRREIGFLCQRETLCEREKVGGAGITFGFQLVYLFI